ncbi:MAG: hypothetical protein HY721_04700 [Planctomycetes bacterium]|nr:hypothetical protein [Planctomycetota bacterium]
MAKRERRPWLLELTAHRAMSDALYEKLLDEHWDEIVAVLDAPRVREARRAYLRALAEELAKRDGDAGA